MLNHSMKNRIIRSVFFILILFIFSQNKANATILFQDNFNDGDSVGWTKIGPNANTAWKVEGGVYKGRVITPSTNIDTVAGDESWGDYVLEFDMMPKQGADKHIKSKWTTALGFTHEIHFTGGGFDTSGGNVVFSPIFNGGIYHMKLVYEGKKVSFYRDNVLMLEEIYNGLSLNGKIGFRVGTGASSPSEVWFDNVKVTTLDDSQNILSVPLLKQNANPWGPMLYDSANLWAGSQNDISRWGCALTSAAMVFQYHGVKKMPDNSNLDPGTLNSWLKSQQDGYIRNGLVNWLALSRLSYLTRFNNNYDQFDALEYKRINSANKVQLTNDLENKIPGILEEPGHFVVAKGKDDANNTFVINDPFYSRESLLDYGNTFLSLGRFVPSQTDLSYLMFVVDDNIDLTLKDSNGNDVGELYQQDAIDNPLNDSEGNAKVKVLYFEQPEGGNYTVVLNSSDSSSYSLEAYLYDIEGNVKKLDFGGLVGDGAEDTYEIGLNKEDSSQSNASQIVSFDSLKSDIILLYKLGKIKNFGRYTAWVAQVDQAKFLSRITKKGTKVILNSLKNQIENDKKAIDDASKSILINQINILINSL